MNLKKNDLMKYYNFLDFIYLIKQKYNTTLYYDIIRNDFKNKTLKSKIQSKKRACYYLFFSFFCISFVGFFLLFFLKLNYIELGVFLLIIFCDIIIKLIIDSNNNLYDYKIEESILFKDCFISTKYIETYLNYYKNFDYIKNNFLKEINIILEKCKEKERIYIKEIIQEIEVIESKISNDLLDSKKV